MTVYSANLVFKRDDNISIAKVIFDYFLAQYADAIRRQKTCGATLASFHAANQGYQEKMDGEGMGVGGWYNLPYNDSIIKIKNEELARIDEEVKDAEAIVKFMRNRFLAGMV